MNERQATKIPIRFEQYWRAWLTSEKNQQHYNETTTKYEMKWNKMYYIKNDTTKQNDVDCATFLDVIEKGKHKHERTHTTIQHIKLTENYAQLSAFFLSWNWIFVMSEQFY